SDATLNRAASAVPNLTALAPANPAPEITTVVPPSGGPPRGLRPLTIAGAAKVNWSAAVIGLVPPGALTVTSTTPGSCAGLVAVTCESESTVKALAGVVPNETSVVPLNAVPVITTCVPPA